MTEFEKAAERANDSTREWGLTEEQIRSAPLVPSPSRYRVDPRFSDHVKKTLEQAVDPEALKRLRSLP